jgi:hypothetical protein
MVGTRGWAWGVTGLEPHLDFKRRKKMKKDKVLELLVNLEDEIITKVENRFSATMREVMKGGSEEPEEPESPLADWWKVRTNFLGLDSAGNLRDTLGYAGKKDAEREEIRQRMLDEGHTHMAFYVRTKDPGDLGHNFDYYGRPEKFTKRLLEVREAGLAPLVFLFSDDDRTIARLPNDQRIEIAVTALRNWGHLVSSVCIGLEWDEWARQNGEQAWEKQATDFVAVLKRRFPDLKVWVHFRGDVYFRVPKADGILYQGEIKNDNGTRRTPDLYRNEISAPGRRGEQAEEDRWQFVYFEFAQGINLRDLPNDTREVALAIREGVKKGCQDMGWHETYGQ